MIQANKFYIRYKNNIPESLNLDYANRGFWQLNVETCPFEDLSVINDLSPTTGVSGYICDVQKSLLMLNKPIPNALDYPDKLLRYLNRDIYQSTIGEIRESNIPIFIKPVQHKLFTGFVYNGDKNSRLKIVTLQDSTQIWCSSIIPIISEYRCFVLENKILDTRLYNGSWSDSPSRILLEQAVVEMRNSSPRAYTLDWGITDKGGTFLIEMNDGFSFGHYGLQPHLYAQMLSARWHELTI